MPYFRNFRLTQITPSNVKQYRLYMLQERKLSYKTVNDACAVLKMITDNAILDNLIVNSPLRGIKPLMKNPSPREAFTTEDARKVLAFPWKEEGWRFFCFFAALTGMRLAEIHAVRRENVKDTYIDLQDQYLNGKLRPLKTKTSRKVPLCKELHDIIEKRIRESPNGYAFYDVAETMASKKLSEYLAEIHAVRRENVKDTYIDLQDQYLNGKLRPLKTKTSRKVPLCKELHDIIEKRIRESPNGYAFYDVAETMASKKLSEYLAKYMPERKKEKGYCFHSWRHFFNTYLLSKNVSPVKVAAVLGHSVGLTSVQSAYTNFTEADYEEVYEQQKILFKLLRYW